MVLVVCSGEGCGLDALPVAVECEQASRGVEQPMLCVVGCGDEHHAEGVETDGGRAACDVALCGDFVGIESFEREGIFDVDVAVGAFDGVDFFASLARQSDTFFVRGKSVCDVVIGKRPPVA